MPPSLTLRDGARGFLFSSGAPVAGVVVEALGRALCSGCSVSVMEGSAAALREALLRRLVARAEWDIVHSAAVSACFPSANQRDLGTGAAQCVSTSGVRRSLAGSAGGLPWPWGTLRAAGRARLDDHGATRRRQRTSRTTGRPKN